jgi:hypothetical protein
MQHRHLLAALAAPLAGALRPALATTAAASNAINTGMRRSDLAGKPEKLGLVPVFDTPQQFAATLKDERAA